MAKRTKNKPGRPAKSPKERATHRVTVNFSSEEMEEVIRRAEMFQNSQSEVVKRGFLSSRVLPPLPLDQKKLAMDVGRLGHNMNQIARRLHTLHGRIDVAEKYRVEHQVSMEEVQTIALECQAQYEETIETLRVIRDILIDHWDGTRGRPGGDKA